MGLSARHSSNKKLDNYLFIGTMIFLLLLFVGLPILCFTGFNKGYSEGSRAGSVIKFSNKGMFWKSYEGEMVLGGVSKNSEGNMVANTWRFTVTDEKFVEQIEKAQMNGDRIKMKYIQWMVSPIEMSSNYEIIGIELDELK